MMASNSSLPSHFIIKSSCHHHHLRHSPHLEVATTAPPKRRRRKPSLSSYNINHLRIGTSYVTFNPKVSTVVTRVSSDGDDGAVDATQQQESRRTEEKNRSSSAFGDSYVSLFVRMLGLDNDPLDREQAIVALWKYSLGGKKCIDNIMQFQGCINLTINILKSQSRSASEAAAGLLRSISSVNQYRDVVAESGAIEELTGLLTQPSLTSEVKKQSICTLWNLSVDEKHGVKIANSYILPLVIKSLEDKDIGLKEAAGGVLANLALSHSNHNIMVEAGVIPKLAEILNAPIDDESKVIRKEARNALVELAKNDYYRILVIEEGLVPVPLIGAAAYRSFTPSLHSYPCLPDGTKIERTSRGPSRYGASELLLGLNIDDKHANIEEAKIKAIIGRSKQHFLARTGAIEVQDAKLSETELSTSRQFTLLPWLDGVARLVLILELEDESAICRALESIADASINEHMRVSFREAGAVKNLVRLLDCNNDAIRFAAIGALDRLSVSNGVCQTIETEGVMPPLINILKNSETSESMMEKALDLLARILDPDKEMKAKFYDGPVNGSKKSLDAARGPDSSIGLTTNINEVPMEKINTRQDLLDSDVIARLVETLKHSSPNLQRKAASILEFVAITDSSMNAIFSVNTASALEAVFEQHILSELESYGESQQLEVSVLKVEEAGLVISAAARLLSKLLDSEQFYCTIDSTHFTKLLREILKSNIQLHFKDWVAAALVKLGYLYGPTPNVEFESPINIEVTLYETIPRLIEQIRSSFSPETQEAAAIELDRIISGGVVDATRAVASEGGIFPLVKLIEGGSERAVEAALSILYNLSMDSENHSAILAAGAVPALRRIILSQRSQWQQALHLLRTLPT